MQIKYLNLGSSFQYEIDEMIFSVDEKQLIYSNIYTNDIVFFDHKAGKKVNVIKGKLHGPSMFDIKAKIYGVLYKQSSSMAFDETSSYWSVPKTS